jgi:hypothetical protein
MAMDAVDLENVSRGFLAFSWGNLSPRDRAKVMADFPQTVWLFGAGASHHYNLNARGVPVPLANGFFSAFNDLPTSEGFHAHVGPLISFLCHHRGVNPFDVAQWSENIEDFMTSVESELNEIKEKKSKKELNSDEMGRAISLSAVFNNMLFIFANVINEAQNGPSESVYKYLLNFCGPNDTFITFNWDTLLDRALADTGGWSPNDGYGLSFSMVLDSKWEQEIESSSNFQTKWKLLKLHGSTNWLVPYASFHFQTLDYAPLVQESEKVFLYWQSTLQYETYRGRWRGGYAPTCYCYYPPNIPSSVFSTKQLSPGPGRVWIKTALIGMFSPFREPSVDGIPSSPLLITPVRQKRYDMYQTTIESIWQQSKVAMKTADKIVVVGYSFPLTDKRPLELLRNSLDSREGEIIVEIVSPSANDIVSRIGADYLSKAKKVTTHSVKFEEYLQILGKDAPELMKKGAKKHKEVKAWLDRIYAIGQNVMETYRE